MKQIAGGPGGGLSYKLLGGLSNTYLVVILIVKITSYHLQPTQFRSILIINYLHNNNINFSLIFRAKIDNLFFLGVLLMILVGVFVLLLHC